MELQIKADLTQTLCVRQMHELIEIDIREDKKFTCLFINKEQAKQVIAKLQEYVGENSNENGALPIPDVVGRSEQLQNCNCKRFEQRIDGRFYCIDCGKVKYTVL
jgi:transcription elongation factor Elf1